MKKKQRITEAKQVSNTTFQLFSKVVTFLLKTLLHIVFSTRPRHQEKEIFSEETLSLKIIVYAQLQQQIPNQD